MHHQQTQEGSMAVTIDAKAQRRINRFDRAMQGLEKTRWRYPMPPPNRITREDAERRILAEAYCVDRAAVAFYEIEIEDVGPVMWGHLFDRLEEARSNVALGAMRFLQRDPRMTGDMPPSSLYEPAQA